MFFSASSCVAFSGLLLLVYWSEPQSHHLLCGEFGDTLMKLFFINNHHKNFSSPFFTMPPRELNARGRE